MYKKKYIQPNLDVVTVDVKDIIVTSGCGGDCNPNEGCITDFKVASDIKISYE